MACVVGLDEVRVGQFEARGTICGGMCQFVTPVY